MTAETPKPSKKKKKKRKVQANDSTHDDATEESVSCQTDGTIVSIRFCIVTIEKPERSHN